MQRILFVSGAVLAVLITVAVLRPVRGAGTKAANSANDAAFRDGAYLGRLAAEAGEAPRVALGRWGSADDRHSFASGYEEGYAKRLTDMKSQSRATDGPYRDGLYQGRLDAQDTRPVHITSGRWSRHEDRSSFSQGYKQAYATVSAMRGHYDQSVREALLQP
jgi:hypothetical protein